MSYLWILSSNPCQQCIVLSSLPHSTKPQRPHKMCQCTFVEVSGRGDGNCKAANQITGIQLSHVDADYTSNEPDYSVKHLHHEYTVNALCGDGTELEIVVVVEVTGQELASRIDALDKEWDAGGTGEIAESELSSYTQEKALDKAMEILNDRCPECVQRPNS